MSALRFHALKRLRRVAAAIKEDGLVRVCGSVESVSPTHLSINGLSAFVRLGDYVELANSGATEMAEVVRIDGVRAIVKPFGVNVTTGVGEQVWRRGPLTFAPCAAWKGRVINALGEPIDGLGQLPLGSETTPLDAAPPAAMTRGRVHAPLRTGVRVIDLFAPICAGQRIGVFAGSGVGKSTLLAMLAGARGFGAVVIALVGERGREVREFLEDALGANRKLAVVVVATGDESPMMRRLAPKTAMSVAEYFRDRGESVLLIVDSITRFAHAARDVALAAGEPAVARGYAPSVFTEMPKLLERAGPGADGAGSITGVFSVLVDGDDHNDPVADAVRGVLDGHIVLDRAIADQGRYPAVDILSSVSRLALHVWTPEQRALIGKLKAMIARFEDTRDLRLMGGYRAGSDVDLDQALALTPRIYAAMAQAPDSPPSDDAFQELAQALNTP